MSSRLSPTAASAIVAVCIALSAGIAPVAHAQYPVTVQSNMVFASGAINRHTVPGARSILLDIYRPVGAPSTDRALVLVHGGGFVSGDRRSPDMVDIGQGQAIRIEIRLQDS